GGVAKRPTTRACSPPRRYSRSQARAARETDRFGQGRSRRGALADQRPAERLQLAIEMLPRASIGPPALDVLLGTRLGPPPLPDSPVEDHPHRLLAREGLLDVLELLGRFPRHDECQHLLPVGPRAP